MAIFEQPIINGIQLGKKLDVCMVCSKLKGKGTPGELEYKEVFKIHLNGIEYTLCMDHFQDLLGDYVLINKNDLTEDEVLELDGDIVENGTVEEVEAHIKETTKKKGKK